MSRFFALQWGNTEEISAYSCLLFVCFFVFRSPKFVAFDKLLDWPTNSKNKLILALRANVRAAFAVMGGEFDEMSPADRKGKILGRICLTTWVTICVLYLRFKLNFWKVPQEKMGKCLMRNKSFYFNRLIWARDSFFCFLFCSLP